MGGWLLTGWLVAGWLGGCLPGWLLAGFVLDLTICFRMTFFPWDTWMGPTLETEAVSKLRFGNFRVGSVVWHPSFDKSRVGIRRLNIFVLHI